MAKFKFKVGDKVVIKDDLNFHNFENGEVVVIKEVDRYGGYTGYRVGDTPENWMCFDDREIEEYKEEVKVQKFKVGDKVRMVNLRSDGLSYSFDKIGNEGVVTGIGPKFIQVDVHCRDNTWEGNGWTYPLNLKCWELVEEEKEMSKCKFKVGDLVRGNEPDRYFVTNNKMTKAEVIGVYNNDYIRVKVLEHMDGLEGLGAYEFDVEPEYFDFYEEPKKEVKVTPQFKVGDKVKVLDELYGHGFNIGQVVEIVEICHDEELLNNKTYNYECRSDEDEVWYLDDVEIELVQKEKPKTTVLKLGDYKIIFNGDTTVVTDGTRKGVAKRHPEDEYDAVAGLQVAIERFNGGRKPKIGDKVRVLKVDGNSKYSDHHWNVGDIAEVVDFVYNGEENDIKCFKEEDGRFSFQTLIAGEYEVLG